MDWLTSVYLGCFIFGLIFTVASFLLGGLDHFSVGGHGDLGGDANVHLGHAGDPHLDTAGHAHAPAHAHIHSTNEPHTHTDHPQVKSYKETLGWFNFSALVVFLTWFGGAGFIFKSLQVMDWFTMVLALLSGVVGYMAVMLFLSKVLVSSQTPVMRQEDYDLTGTVGRVTSTIFENGTGEVIFSKHGTRRAVSARTTDGKALPRESQVVILRFENGVALVEELDKLLSDAGADKWSTSGPETALNTEELKKLEQ
jgi:membrane protein implicated in regulation of membrane protease activity